MTGRGPTSSDRAQVRVQDFFAWLRGRVDRPPELVLRNKLSNKMMNPIR
jgi:hypothetical protein